MSDNVMLQGLLRRRSVRKYSTREVEQEKIDAVIEAGLYAPSGMGRQSAIIVECRDPKLKEMLVEENRRIGGFAAGMDPFYGAPVLLIVLADRNNPNHVCDGALALGNMLNAAYALDLGSCWINRAAQEFELPQYREYLRKAGIGDEYIGIGHCILGYPEGELPKPAARRPGRVYRI
ncbi:MAG: nitroreductase [Succinivibrio sp.]|nr:nitroreductase [Succinivibrio sp.]